MMFSKTILFSDCMDRYDPDNKYPITTAIKMADSVLSNGSILVEGCINEKLLDDEISQFAPPAFENAMNFDVGIDEVGRGPIYGSVVIVAALLPKKLSGAIDTNLLGHTPLKGLTDSKKLSEKKRNSLSPIIKNMTIGYVVIDIAASLIDALNIYQAVLLGMRLASESMIVAILQILALYTQKHNHRFEQRDIVSHFNLLIDGNVLPAFDWSNMIINDLLSLERKVGIAASQVNAEAWVKGDSRHTTIAAASVIAKVYRDDKLIADAKRYPDYQLDKHKGYPTKAHLLALKKYGALAQHRRSFKPVANLNKAV